MTFSIASRCPETGQLGIALSSSSMAVGARCPWLLAGVGAVSSQNITLPALGQRVLVNLDAGVAPQQALSQALAEDKFSRYRQVILIDASGETAWFSGDKTLGVFKVVTGNNCIAAGNMLADQSVIDAMIRGFEQAAGELSSRLIAALRAGLAQGGERGPVHSAGVSVVGDCTWPMVDLRVDWSDNDPVAELEQLWQVYAPQMQAYITRALDPREAPSYGVPGDE